MFIRDRKARDEIVSALYYLLLIAVPLLKDLHHYSRHYILEDLQALVAVILHIGNKEIIPQVIIVFGEVCQIQLEHHHHIFFAGIGKAVHLLSLIHIFR